MLATHKPHKTVFGKTIVELKSGQLITSRLSLAAKTGLHESRVERILKTMIFEQQIEQQSSNVSRLISIRNWNQYQSTEQQIEQPSNNGRTAGEQPANTNKNVKNEENGRISPLVLPLGDQVETPTAEEIYTLYPHKVGKPSALKAIRKALKCHSAVFLRDKTAAYAEAVRGTDTLLPNPATWFKDERYEDDPSTWVRDKPSPRVNGKKHINPDLL